MKTIFFYITIFFSFMLFKPWFKTNENKPTKINNYNIIYSYRMISTINPSLSCDIDSFYIEKKSHKVTLFLQKKMIKEFSVEELLVKIDRFSYVSFNNGIMYGEKYICKDQNIIKKYMKEILKLY